MTLKRLQRWAIILTRFKTTDQNANANAPSRLPMVPDIKFDEKLNQEEVKVNEIRDALLNDFPMDVSMVAEQTKKDHVLSKVCTFVINGWPTKSHQPTYQRAFANIRQELTIH